MYLWGRIFRRVWTKASDVERTTPIFTQSQHISLFQVHLDVPFGASWDLDPCCRRGADLKRMIFGSEQKPPILWGREGAVTESNPCPYFWTRPAQLVSDPFYLIRVIISTVKNMVRISLSLSLSHASC